MHQCKHCNTLNLNDAKVCLSCGAKLHPEGKPKFSIANIYENYRKQNQLPFFLMLVFGIGAILFGVGFLVHYTFENYVGTVEPIIKISVAFAFSLLFLFSGIYLLSRKKRDTGLLFVWISVLGNFILSYFFSRIDTDFLSTNEYSTLFLVIFNSVISFVFTVLYRDKLLAITGLLGGVLSPFYLPFSAGELYYLVFLLIICILAIYTTELIAWKNYGVLTFFVATAVIQVNVFSVNVYYLSFYHLVFFHIFTAVFIYLGLFEMQLSTQPNKRLIIILEEKLLKKVKTNIQTVDLYILIINFAFFLIDLFYYFKVKNDFFALGVLYILNAMPYVIGVLIYQKQMTTQVKLLLLTYSALLVGIAIPLVANVGYIGFFWTIEALVAIHIGFIYASNRARIFGYGLLSISVVLVFESLGFISEVWQENLFNSGFFNLLYIGGLIIILSYLLKLHAKEQKVLEEKLQKLLFELFSIWLIITYFIIMAHLNALFISLAVMSIIPVYYMIYRGHTKELIISKFLGYSFYVMFLFFCLYLAAYRLIEDLPNTLFATGYYSLIISCVMIATFRYWYIFVNVIEVTKSYIKIKSVAFDEASKKYDNYYYGRDRILIYSEKFLIILLLILYFLTVNYFFPQWNGCFAILPAAYLLYIGYMKDLIFERFAGYSLYIFAILYSLFWASALLPNEWQKGNFDYGFVNYLFTGFIIISLAAVLHIINKAKSIYVLQRIAAKTIDFTDNSFFTKTATQIRAIGVFWKNRQVVKIHMNVLQAYDLDKYFVYLQNYFTLWFSGLYIILCFYFVPAWAFQLQFFLVFVLLIYGLKQELNYTLFYAAFVYILMAISAFFAFKAVGFHLSGLGVKQLVLMGEVYFCLWLFKTVFRKIDKEHKHYGVVKAMRVTFYFGIPLLLIYFSIIKLFDILPYMLWAAVFIAFFITEISRNFLLRIEFYALLAFAFLLSILLLNSFAVIIGFLCVATIYFTKKIIIKQKFGFAEYKPLWILLWYYFGIVLFFVYILFLPADITTAIFISTTYFLALLNVRHKVLSIYQTYLFAYRLSYVLILSGLYFFASDDITVLDFNLYSYKLLSLIFMFVCFFLLHKLIYEFHAVYPGEMLSKRWIYEMRFLHFIYVIGYNSALYYFTSDWGSLLLTFTMIFHSIILLFSSIKPKYQPLLSVSLIISLTALFKLLYFDMRSLTVINRVLIFLFIGAIFLGAAYIFNKRKDKIQKNK